MLGSWLRDNASCYIGNATAMRDFRVQLRGNRAILLWSFYLIILIGFAMIVYNQSAAGYRTSIVEAQAKLRGFYQGIMVLLAVMINLITPALTAGAIVMERQRRSLDLVFSAPVSAKYFLVGKMISSYRYTWMLLVLSLPVTSACVVLGGATWSDVISAYLILSFNGLMYTSIALLISTLAKQPVSAVIWSYTAAIFYSIASGIFIGSSFLTIYSTGRTMEAPFVITMNPYLAVFAAPTFTDLWGHHIPNWIFGGLVSLLICKLMLLGAASALSGYGSKDTKSLRIHILVYSLFYLALVGFTVGSAVGRMRGLTSGGTLGTTSPPASWDMGVNLAFGWMLMPLVVFIPFLTCYGVDSEHKFQPDGAFSVRRMLLGTPSGGLPFVLTLILTGWLGMSAMLRYYTAPALSPAILVWALAFWLFMWSIGRLTSSFAMGLRSARALHFTIMMALIALPVPFFGAASTFDSSSGSIWDIYILRPLMGTQDNTVIALVMAAILAISGAVITYIAEINASRKAILQGQTA